MSLTESIQAFKDATEKPCKTMPEKARMQSACLTILADIDPDDVEVPTEVFETLGADMRKAALIALITLTVQTMTE